MSWVKSMHAPARRRLAGIAAAAAAAALSSLLTLAPAGPARAVGSAGIDPAPARVLGAGQRAVLLGIARDTWKFYAADVDPRTHLPLDNLTFAGGSATPTGYGRYTSASNVGVYLWSVVAARDLGLISASGASARITGTGEVATSAPSRSASS